MPTDTNNTILLLGDPGAGKTTFALTFPKPRCLFPTLERGWLTLNSMTPDQFYNKDELPEYRKIASSVDMMRELNLADTDLKKNPNAFRTLIIDSITAYARMHLAFLETLGIKNKMEVYGQLGSHLTQVLIKAHSLECNVVWTGHVNPENGQVDLSGKSVTGFQSTVIDLVYLVIEEEKKRVIATTAYGKSRQLRCKGKNVPPTIPLTNYREVAKVLEWE